MPIVRRVEYLVTCDGPDCLYSEAHNCDTRAEAIEAAPRHGWVRCSRGRWLCEYCAEKLLPKVAMSVATNKVDA